METVVTAHGLSCDGPKRSGAQSDSAKSSSGLPLVGDAGVEREQVPSIVSDVPRLDVQVACRYARVGLVPTRGQSRTQTAARPARARSPPSAELAEQEREVLFGRSRGSR